MNRINPHVFKRALYENAAKNRIPLDGAFELTPLCNLDCRMCYVHLRDPSVTAKMLSGKQWITVMRDAVARGMIYVLLTGGEALTHPDFWEIYGYLAHAGVRVQLKTNGLLLNAETVRRFTEYPPNIIDVSLYGCNRESCLAVTGHDVFDAVTANIRRVADAGLPLRIAVTPSAFMFPWIDDMLAFAKSFGLPVRVSGFLLPAREENGNRREQYDLTPEQLAYIAKKTRELFGTEVSLEGDDAAGEPYGAAKDRADACGAGLRCGAGRTGFAVHWNGVMTPCLPFPEAVISADARGGFDEAWDTVARESASYESPEACAECAYHGVCHYCPSFHGSFAVRRECDPEVCRRLRYLADENAKH